MALKDYFLLILKSLNPDGYKDITQKSFRECMKYLFFIIVLSIVVMIILAIPKIYSLQNTLEKDLDYFTEFKLSANVSMEKPLTVMKSPKIAVNFGKENITDETVLINDKSIMYKDFLYFGDNNKIIFSEYKNILNKKEQINKIIVFMIILLIPSILLVIFVIYSIKYFMIIALTSIIAYLVCLAASHRIKFKQILKIGIFATTIMAILDIALLPYYRFFWLPIILYLILFILAVILVGEKSQEVVKEKAKKIRY